MLVGERRHLAREYKYGRWGSADVYTSESELEWNLQGSSRRSLLFTELYDHHEQQEEEEAQHPVLTPSPTCSPIGSSQQSPAHPADFRFDSASLIYQRWIDPRNGGGLKEETTALRRSSSSRSDRGLLFAAKANHPDSKEWKITGRPVPEDRPRAFSVRRANLRRNLSSNTALDLGFSEFDTSARLDRSVDPSCAAQDTFTSNNAREYVNFIGCKPKTQSERLPVGFDPLSSLQTKLLAISGEIVKRDEQVLESVSSAGGDGDQAEGAQRRNAGKEFRTKLRINGRGSRVSSTGSSGEREKPAEHMAKREKAGFVLRMQGWIGAGRKLKRQEAVIVAWEGQKKVEKKLEEKRTRASAKTEFSIGRDHRKAEDKKAGERAKIGAETARVSTMVEKLRYAGKWPWKFLF